MDKIEKQDDAVLLAHALAYHLQKQGNRLAADIIRAAIPAIPGLTDEALEARMDSAPQPPAEAQSCPECHGTGGHFWHEADGSERGDKCGTCDGFGHVYPAEAQAQAAALEAAQEDADRYRWLRDVGMRGWWVVARQAERGGVYQQAPESIDAAIDQARGKGGVR